MAIKKSELYSSLWKSCDELRGGMDASQYKDYVLVLLFVKYVSDKYAGNRDALLVVPPDGSFTAMIALKNDKEIGDKINKLIGRLADANPDLLGSIKNAADFNSDEKLGSGQEKIDRLTKLVAIFEGLNFGRNRAEGDDLLGDAYEYLMRHFATESGKSKGQFYTPAEVSRVLAKVIDLGKAHSAKQSIYDPTCGSGSLLLKAHDEAKSEAGVDLAMHGQEMDNATASLARMNMVLHDCPGAVIHRENTLASPFFKQADGRLKTFDFVVANPPFSTKAWASGIDPLNDPYGRFEYGIPPEKNGDYAFLLHILASLKSTGKGAVILPHGVLFRGNAEAEIREKIVSHGYIKGIIGLPANLFYGTGIPACILVLDKEHAHARKGIFVIDASRGFMKDGNKNRLRAQDIHKIVDTFTRQQPIERYSRMVPLAEIAANDYNLNLPRYIDSSEPEDLQDIEGHLKGGIPERDIDGLANYWQVLPSLRLELFWPDRPGYYCVQIESSGIKAFILGFSQFAAFRQQVDAVFADWKRAHRGELAGIQPGDQPKTLIEALSESLLEAFRTVPLLDAYDIYQHLMDYWAGSMQDDVYMLASDGWLAGRVLRELVPGKDKKGKAVYTEAHDFVFDKKRYKVDLIPPALIVARYFAAEQADVDLFQAAALALEQQCEELKEEHSGDEGLLVEAMDEGKLTAKGIKDRLKQIRHQSAFADEREVLDAYLHLLEQEANASRQAKLAQADLDQRVASQYAKLSEADIKTLVVEDKWLGALDAAVQGELDRVSQSLTGRIRELADRYATPLPKLSEQLQSLGDKVDQHLQKMGFAWR
ncbi:MAG: type I restriction-modification system subunit M [Rhodanobacter sp.]